MKPQCRCLDGEIYRMAVPQYSSTPTTPFLTELANLGYSSWLSFDFTEETAFFKAQGEGLLMHTSVHYSAIGAYIDRSWNPKIQTLTSVLAQFPSPARYEDANYWREVGSKASQFAIKFFREAGKTEHANQVQRGKCPDKDNTVAYKSLCNHLNMCLTWYENTVHGSVTHVFCNEEKKNEVCLFVNIAQDSNRLYLLFHRDFETGSQVTAPGFPYYMLSGTDMGPIMLGREVAGVRGAAEGMEELAGKLVEVTEILARIIKLECPAVQEGTLELIGSLRDKFGTVNALLRVSRLRKTLDSEDIRAVLALSAYSAGSQEPQLVHSVHNCEQFAHIDGNYVLPQPHGHNFHVTCLSAHIRSLGLVYPAVPQCPSCENPLPDSVFDICPEIQKAYAERKHEHVTVYSTSNQIPPSPSELGIPSPISTSLQKSITCVSCCSSYPSHYFMQHGCAICLHCGVWALEQNGIVCLQCQKVIPQYDQESLRSYNLDKALS